MELTGKRALITGASGGIGGEVALALAARGVRVAVQGRRQEELLRLQSQAACPLVAVTADLTDESAANAAVDKAAEALGGLDTLVHCAGVSQSSNPPFERILTREYRRIMSTNVDGSLFVLRRSLQYLRVEETGYIINILSTAATSAGAGGGVYAASKHAARALQEALLAECRGSSVRVSSISPGPVRTGIWSHKDTPPSQENLRHMLSPKDIAQIVVFLLTRDAHIHIPDIRVEPWIQVR